jgi:hypothetical protein
MVLMMSNLTTRLAGLSAYRAALNDSQVSQVTLLVRREIPSWAKLPPNADKKSQVIIHKDFTEYPPELMSRIADHNACIWALGKSSFGISEEEYTLLTHTYAVKAMKALIDTGAGSEEKPFQFVYISSNFVDSTPKFPAMWSRVKVSTFLGSFEYCLR